MKIKAKGISQKRVNHINDREEKPKQKIKSAYSTKIKQPKNKLGAEMLEAENQQIRKSQTMNFINRKIPTHKRFPLKGI